MLLHALHGRAALGAEQGVEVIVAAFDGALQDRADIRAGPRGHVIAGDIGGRAPRRAQPAGKAAGKIQQRLGNITAVIAQRQLSLFHCLCDQLVLRVLKQVFKINQMFQVFQNSIHPFLSFAVLNGKNIIAYAGLCVNKALYIPGR